MQNDISCPSHEGRSEAGLQPAAADDLQRDPLEELAAEFVERHRLGECPSIEEYARQHPELADEIRDLFPTIASLEKLKLERERSSGERAATGLPCLMQLGDFRIIGEIGRGGMGVVYEAEQLSLRRLVALKVLGAQIANSARQLKRFRREAEAAARLHHTNIVPIFAIGEADNVHYYAMQFISGPTLAEIIHAKAQAAGIPRRSSAQSQGSESAGSQAAAPLENEVVISETVLDQSGLETPPLDQPAVVEYIDRRPAGQAPQFIVGATSSNRYREQIEAFPHNQWKDVARLGSQLADALAYAHDQGILHRDIKPANVLIDQDGLPWLADFGLAKHEDHEGVTNSGDIVGTLRFMAPEQFHGKGDWRSDVYSLGLTLYELLTLRPAFDESRHAPLVKLKSTQAPKPPRSLNSAIPRDLETIVLKACATEPEHRYQSSEALRDDLQRFVADLPIQARRLTPTEHVWRWARRNPLVASLASLTTGLLITLAVVLAVSQYRTQKVLDRVERERGRAEDNLVLAQSEGERAARNLKLAKSEGERAAANLKLAMAALDRMIDNIAVRGVPQSLNAELEEESTPLRFVTATPADASLLEELVQFFHRFAEQNEADLKYETAQAYCQIGDIRERLGQPIEAETAYRKALEILEVMRSSSSEDRSLQMLIADVWNDIGVACSFRGAWRDAEQAHSSARDILKDLLNDTDDDAKFKLAQTYNLLNSVFVRSGTTELLGAGLPPGGSVGPAGTGFVPPTNPRRGPAADRDGFVRRNSFPENSSERNPFGGPPQGERRGEDRRNADDNRSRRPFPEFSSSAMHSAAVSLLRELIQKHPEHSEYRMALASSFRNRSRTRQRSGEDLHEAEYAGLESIGILRQLVKEDPSNPSFKYELADTYCLMSRQLQGYPLQDRFEWQREAFRLTTELRQANPLVTEYQSLLAMVERGLANLEREVGHLDQAAQHYQIATTLQAGLASRYPTIRLYLFSRAQTLSEWADLESSRGNQALAEQKLNSAISAIEQSLQPGVENRGHQMFLGRLKLQQAVNRGDVPEVRGSSGSERTRATGNLEGSRPLSPPLPAATSATPPVIELPFIEKAKPE